MSGEGNITIPKYEYPISHYDIIFDKNSSLTDYSSIELWNGKTQSFSLTGLTVPSTGIPGVNVPKLTLSASQLNYKWTIIGVTGIPPPWKFYAIPVFSSAADLDVRMHYDSNLAGGSGGGLYISHSNLSPYIRFCKYILIFIICI